MTNHATLGWALIFELTGVHSIFMTCETKSRTPTKSENYHQFRQQEGGGYTTSLR